MIADLAGAAEPLGRVEKLPEAADVAAARLAVKGQLSVLARLGVPEPEIPAEGGVHLLGRQHVNHVHVEALLLQRPQSRFVSARVEQVGDHHREAAVPGLPGVAGQTLVQPRRAARAQLSQKVEQREDLGPAAGRRPSLGHPVPHDADTDALVVHERHEAERRRQAAPVFELGRLAVVHGGRRVQQQVQAEVFLVDEELQVEPVQPPEDVPVDVAEVVPHPVRPVVHELDAAAAVGALAVALDPAAEGPLREQREPLQLDQEVAGEEPPPPLPGHRANRH